MTEPLPADTTVHPDRSAVHAPWTEPAATIAAQLGVDPATGLVSIDAADRIERFGPNELAAAPKRPSWRRLVAQFTDLLILILIGAAVVSYLVNRELKTPLVVLAVVVLNAVIGFVQEGKAERSLDALRRLTVTTARVRRDGRLAEIPTAHVVPGDIVMIEAGDRVPADGRLLLATTLEVEEAALTGESHPAEKSSGVIDVPNPPVGDRANCVFMNTTVTRGRGEFVVTATGMDTEIGSIAHLLASTETDQTPLQRQLHVLARSLAKLAGLVVAAVVGIGLLRGQRAGELFDTAVALAVASIPEGLPAVTAVTLALGVQRMARQRAIVKRLAAVETLGCTSAICTDKTGTLTLNQMTAREFVIGDRSHPVTGEGYSGHGEIDGLDDPATLQRVLVPMALCNDAELSEGSLVGDPTEGALLALAAKGDVDVGTVRAMHRRVAEIPFDSSTKFMATLHEMSGTPHGTGERVLRVFVKGAPDVLLARCTGVIDASGRSWPIETYRDGLVAHNLRMASSGLRVLAIAEREVPSTLADEQLDQLVEHLTLLGLVAIADPPRPEARAAIADARAAGITVRMITGDHAATAAAIGTELGLTGRAVTGAELDLLDDDELLAALPDISVFARVAPDHKLRLVTLLREHGDVVAMTGDGVNDAPALKRSDIGIAMGITGTEVTKEAATMVLADDNFATIVQAVEQGRAIYANIVHFVRFQLSTTLGFAVLFLLASLLGIAGGKPFSAIAILWVNLIMDGPPAMALGVDPAEHDIMRRTPRPISEPILTRRRWWTIGQAAVVMALGTLAVLEWAPGDPSPDGAASVAGTMAFCTFVLFQFFNLLNARSDHRSVFDRRTLRNRWLWLAVGAVLALQVAVVHVGPLQRLFDTTSLTAAQWAVCVAVASSVLWVEEVRKAVVRRRIHPVPRVDLTGTSVS